MDQEAAVVIRKIFNMTIAGMSTGQIARELNASKIDIPTVHQAKQGQGTSALERHPDPYIWSSTTARNILNRREYLGHTVNFRTKKHFKDKNSHYVPEDQWVEFENTHPAIIDPDTFEEAGKRRKKKEVGAASEPHPFTGIVICADCGSQMYSIKRKGNDPVYNFVCSSYMKRPIGTICGTAHCTSSLALETAIREKLDWLKSIAKEKGIGVIDDLYEAQGET